MILTQTIIVPSLFDEDNAPKFGGEDITIAAQKQKHILDEAITSGWRIVHCNPIVYMNVAYIHYVLEIDEAAYLRSRK